MRGSDSTFGAQRWADNELDNELNFELPFWNPRMKITQERPQIIHWNLVVTSLPDLFYGSENLILIK